MKRQHSILIIDDTDFLPEAIATKLVKKGYTVSVVHTVLEARSYLKSPQPPTFILADRILDNGPIELRELVGLCRLASMVSAEVLVYTDKDNLSKEKQQEILNKGAYQVLSKDDVEKLKDDVDILIKDLDEQAELTEELNALSSDERSKFITALVGADVALNVLDDKFRHRYSKSAPQPLDQTIESELKSDPERSGVCRSQCWLAQFHEPAVVQKCWGCTVAEVFKSGTTVEGLFLNRQTNGSVGWVDVQSKPIKSPSTGNTIAVREAVATASEVVLSNLTLDRRLRLIAESLIRAGFGRARIYTFDPSGVNATLCAAAAWSDDPLNPKSSYFESISSLNLELSASVCPYAKEAQENRIGSFVSEWDARGPSALSSRIDLQPPYFDVPIYREDRTLHSWLSVDFSGIEEPLRTKAINQYAKTESLTWLREEFGRAIRLADDTEGKQGYREKFEIVRRARFGIFNARSVDAAISEIRDAFTALLPACQVTVRIKKDFELERFDRLCWSAIEAETIPKYSLEDTRSLAVAVVKHPLPKWISDYSAYVEKAKESGDPIGYFPEGTQSAAELPLRLENIVLGTLGISSPIAFQWADDGYKEPLIALTKEIALVLRDLVLQEAIDRAMSDRAAMIAYSISVSADGLWRHWAQQRLSEVSARVATIRTKLERHTLQPEELIEYLKLVSGVIHQIQTAQPLKDAVRVCSLKDVLARLKELYADKKPIPSFPFTTDYRVAVPDFTLRNILMILLDNALWSIQNSRVGTAVSLTIHPGEVNLIINVADDGPGISEELQNQIFRQTVLSDKGQGFGLLYARGAALQYGGDLSFSSVPRSTTFSLSLPLYQEKEIS
jgi:signal transduction histidine kinase